MKLNYDILGNHIRLIDTRNRESITDRVLGINIDKFFMPSVANVIGTDLSKYKLITKGKFACNPMHVGRDERLPVALYEEEEPAIVSPAYFMFERQLFIRKLDIRTVYVKEIEIFREISLFFLSFFALVEKGDVQMKQYIGIKVVAARPMTRGDYNIFRGWQIPADEDPADEGYVMKYENGHMQWLPKDMFESDYKEYDESTLPATAIGMVSSDYKECFQAEYKQLRIRYEKLKRMRQ